MTNCVICGENRVKRLFMKNGYSLVKCENDGHKYISNPPNIEELTKLYSSQYFEGSSLSGYKHNIFEDSKTQLKRAAKRLDKLKKFMKFGKVLDVGCGPGFFVAMSNEDFQIGGVDISRAAQEYAESSFGAKIWLGDFLGYPACEESYDVVTMFSHLEHTINPRKDLEKAREILNPSGLLVLSLPNIDGIPRLLQGKLWRGFSFPEHLHFFNRRNLSQLLQETGFYPVKSSYAENNVFRDTNYFYARKR